MKKSLFVVSISSLLMLTSCDLLSTLEDAGKSIDDTGLTDSQIVSGLKESLTLGSKTAALTLSDTSGEVNEVTNEVTGYLANELLRILLPDDVERAIETVDLLKETTAGKTLLSAAGIDFAEYREAMVRGLNRGAENAAGLSVDVFKTAIQEMTFTSAKEILFGDDSTGATNYLETTTSDVLVSGFKPVIENSLGSVKISALGSKYTFDDVWSKFATNFNKVADAYTKLVTTAESGNLLTATAAQASLSMLENAGVSSVDPLNTNIVDYATEKALDGLFYMVSQQELKIRRDPIAALRDAADFVTDAARKIIEQVFTSSEE